MPVHCGRVAFIAVAAVAATSVVSADERETEDYQTMLDIATLFDTENATFSRRTKAVVVHPSLCGISKRSLMDDHVRRHCLRQCRIETDGFIRPTFAEWERFCKETAGMSEWDSACEDYFCCTFGCDIYGGDRTRCTDIAPSQRRSFLTETIADIMSSGMSQEQRCQMQKCHSYCARRAFNTCREQMFTQACEASNPHLYGCDVTCNSANGLRPALVASLLLAFGWLAAPRA